jgi:uncharacterized protein (DUF1697 family)
VALMGVQIVLLRGVNLGPRNRVSMGPLAEALQAQGLGPARTYLQSGNVVLASELSEQQLADAVKSVVRGRFGVDVDVLVRSHDELAAVVSKNPLAAVATDPKRYQVSFLSGALDDASLERLRALAGKSERLEAAGRELYAWHPGGVARSKLWAGLAARTLGVAATARNWSTVESLLALADDRSR